MLDDVFPINRLAYEKCYNIALKYDNYATFRTSEACVYDKAVKRKWIKEYSWLKRGNRDLNAKINCVYAYEFTEFNAVYVGRTMNGKARFYAHLNDGKDGVYKFIKRNCLSEKGFTLKIFGDGLNMEIY